MGPGQGQAEAISAGYTRAVSPSVPPAERAGPEPRFPRSAPHRPGGRCGAPGALSGADRGCQAGPASRLAASPAPCIRPGAMQGSAGRCMPYARSRAQAARALAWYSRRDYAGC